MLISVIYLNILVTMKPPSKMNLYLKSLIICFLFSFLVSAFSFASGLDLKILWQTNQKTMLESAPILADINRDGKDEVIMAGREELIVLQRQGKELWRWKTRKRFVTYPSVLKRANRAALIFAADNSGLFTCPDGNGRVVWQAELDGPAEWSASAIVDLDGDSKAEVVQTDITGSVWVFDALSGKVIYKIKVKGKPVSPAVGDIDGDGNYAFEWQKPLVLQLHLQHLQTGRSQCKKHQHPL